MLHFSDGSTQAYEFSTPSRLALSVDSSACAADPHRGCDVSEGIAEGLSGFLHLRPLRDSGVWCSFHHVGNESAWPDANECRSSRARSRRYISLRHYPGDV